VEDRKSPIMIWACIGGIVAFLGLIVVSVVSYTTATVSSPATAHAQSRAADTVGLSCKHCDDMACRNYQLIIDLDNRKVAVGTGTSARTYQITDVDDNWINYEDHHPPSDLLIGYYRISINRSSLQIIDQPYDPHGKIMYGYSSTDQCWKRQL
jgi:hypothetical protein